MAYRTRGWRKHWVIGCRSAASFGAPLDQKMPDHATIWRFREALARTGLAEAAFGCVTAQIEAAGLLLKQGTLIDASLIPAAVNRPPPPRGDAPIGADGTPESRLVEHPLDPDAAWTKKDGRHTSATRPISGWIATVGSSAASSSRRPNVNETSCADDLICGDELAVYADKAYDSQARREALRARGIRNGIMRRWHWRWAPPSPWQTRRNTLLIARRAPIEPFFALLKSVIASPAPDTGGLPRKQRRPAPCRHRHEPQTMAANRLTIAKKPHPRSKNRPNQTNHANRQTRLHAQNQTNKQTFANPSHARA